MALPTIHNPTTPIIFIARDDTAWDRDRINYELEVIEGEREPDQDRPVAWDAVEDHPMVRYQLGETRYDLTTVEQYLDQAEGPVRFHFRRLTRNQRNNLLALQQGGQLYAAYEAAFRLGVETIDGVPNLELQARFKKSKTLGEKDMGRIEQLLGRDIFHEVGEAVLRASQDLTRAEKKPSASGPGSSP